MATQKKSYAARLGVLAVALSLVTACLLGGTMAKYVTEVSGTGSATVAAWSFKANDQTKEFTVDLADTANTNVATDRIAPGTKGSFGIKVDATGSETALDYTIAFSNLTNMPDGLKFYSDIDRTIAITDLATYKGFDGGIALTEVGTPVTKTVYWEWAYEGDNTKDTAAGTNASKAASFKITVTGTQKDAPKTS
ncbi:hypothetical protein [Gordonibacter urolithinfaciens]|uniref:hypothetical protein n=1 Tax=Gordonibacter urolithinfaciens TaxID=1335613 RepID=UPI003AAFFBD0